MSSRAFSEAMTQVSNQSEYERENERKQREHQERREAVLGKARGVFVFLLVATIMVFGFNYRVEIQEIIDGKPIGASQAQAHTSEVLKETQDQVAQRDVVLSEITQ